uniref:Uncharacterized protein n=1 Tax=Salix viminalis TaxID=40686 RepID=A0A6N2KE21_SALVM
MGLKLCCQNTKWHALNSLMMIKIALLKNNVKLMEKVKHPRKDKSSIRSQAWRRRKHLDGHCECFEKQALGFIIIDQKYRKHGSQTIKYASKGCVQYGEISIHTSN